MTTRGYGNGAVTGHQDEHTVRLGNRGGSLIIALATGRISFEPTNGRPLMGRFSIEISARRGWIDAGAVTHAEIYEEGRTIGARLGLQLEHGHGSLLVHARSQEEGFVLEVAAATDGGGVRRIAPVRLLDCARSFADGRMLTLAYCGAHSGSVLSRSGTQQVTPTGRVGSWWATALLARRAPSLVAGFLSSHRFVGRAELCDGDLDLFVQTEGRRGTHDWPLACEPLFLTFSEDPWSALRAYAARVGELASYIDRRPVFGWSSWAAHRDRIDLPLLMQTALDWTTWRGQELDAVLQLDHGWEERIGLHRPELSWVARSELGTTLDDCLAQLATRWRGRLGLWVVPFAVNASTKHLDRVESFLVRGADGGPLRVGGAGGSFCIDPTHPEGERWLTNLFGRLRGLGVRYFKLEYLRNLLAPEPDDSEDGLDRPRRFFSGATRVEAFRKGLSIIRAAVGDEVYLLACGSPLLPGAGLVDAQRIGQDIVAAWHDGQTGIVDCARNIAHQGFWNGLAWRNDPDFLVATEEAGLRRFWATAVALSGGSALASLDVGVLETSSREMLSVVLPPIGATSAVRLDEVHTSSQVPERWTLPLEAHGSRYVLVGLFNDSTEAREVSFDVRDLGWEQPPECCLVWEVWSETFLGLLDEAITVRVPPRDVALVALRPLSNHPQLLGTSLHFAQGAVDVERLQWHEADRQLEVTVAEGIRRAGKIFVYVPSTYRSLDCATNGHVLPIEVDPARRTVRLSFALAGDGK